MASASAAATDAADVRRTSSSGAGSSPLRVLTFTSLFPNPEQRLHGLFVMERVRALAQLCSVQVVAPVPWSPPGLSAESRYAAYRRVPRSHHVDGLEVHHPRFAVVPKILKSTDGVLMGLSCIP